MPPKKTAVAAKTSAKTKTAKRKAEKEADVETKDEGSDLKAVTRGRGKKEQTEVEEAKVTSRKKRTTKETVDAENDGEEQTEIDEVKGKNKKKQTAKADSKEMGNKKKRATEDAEEEPKEDKKKKTTKAKTATKSSDKDAAEKKVKSSKKPKKEDEELEETETDNAKQGKKRKAATKTNKNVPDKEGPDNKVPRMNATSTKWENINFECSSTNSKGQTPNFHITSWNVDGLRAWLKKGGLDILQYDQPDIFCIQETKCSTEKLPDEVTNIDGYETLWCSSDKEGYAGVGIATKIKPLNVNYGIDSEEHDIEGRCITAEYEKFFLVNVYVPNAGRKLITLPKRLDWNALFKEYIKKLDAKKPVIICGDMNVAHTEIDLANPKTNTKNAGFTIEEREGLTDFLQDGYVDTFRKLYPDKEKVYTFWTYMANARSKNVGWRLDYFIVSERFMEQVCDNIVHSDVLGSDHCPISLHVNI